ncbi:putative indole-3-pyruvate monooxygenase YUCCA10 [Ananas comosus]|uniref:Flavin-containing monooxygenase n=1 Tax=Ananas comosus TaxID=4615 RepID=A0A199VKQ4_ANACO|nr:putative indole-3-pyruvate monooxygenase YUCCA10 [Ananas comosus]
MSGAIEETVVVIVGAGPSGLAVAACLAARSVPSLILERDDCVAPLWRHRAYDRLHLHLAKRFCALPLLPFPRDAPTFVPARDFLRYLELYAARFAARVRLRRRVAAALFDPPSSTWRVRARALDTGAEEEYAARFVVVAAGENCAPALPALPGLDGFPGPVRHSSEYRSGSGYAGMRVLVVGSGNSGMEIALDLAEAGAKTSIVVRSPVRHFWLQLHILSREMWLLGMILTKFLPVRLVDAFLLFLCYLKYGDTSKYGIRRPAIGPFDMKINTPLYPVLDVGTYDKIRSGEIQVLPAVSSVKGNNVEFSDGNSYPFDAIIFATGYKSTIKEWLQSDEYLIGDDGMAKQKYPNQWKGKNGLYCVGLARRGLYGTSEEAQLIAEDISKEYNNKYNNNDKGN